MTVLEDLLMFKIHSHR